MALRLIKSDIRAKIIQAPRIIALDRQQATIFVGEEIRYAEAKTEQGQAGGLEVSVKEADNSPVSTGFQLLMIPQIVPGTSQVIIEVVPKQTALSGSGGSGAPAGFDLFQVGAGDGEGSIALPRIQSSELMTRMILDSGQTAVIGGLTTDTETEIVRKVPLLGDIPILGWLFKFSSSSKDRRSLIVLITPHIISSAEDTKDFLDNELQERRKMLETELNEIYGIAAEPEEASVSEVNS
jgi:type II secretory pathway component GspD/PulD (secretin)